MTKGEKVMPMIDMPVKELEQYMGINPKPADHDEYWDKAIAEMKAVDPQISMTKAAFQAPNAECYDLYSEGETGFIGKGGMCGQMLLYHRKAGFSVAWHSFEAEGCNITGKLIAFLDEMIKQEMYE